MEKIIHENLVYYYGVMILMSIVIIWNLNRVINGSTFVVIHFLFTIITMSLFVTKNKHSKLVIKIWAGIFFILAGVLLTVGPFLQILGNWMSGEEIPNKLNVIIWGTVNLLVGGMVFVGANKFMTLDVNEKKEG